MSSHFATDVGLQEENAELNQNEEVFLIKKLSPPLRVSISEIENRLTRKTTKRQTATKSLRIDCVECSQIHSGPCTPKLSTPLQGKKRSQRQEETPGLKVVKRRQNVIKVVTTDSIPVNLSILQTQLERQGDSDEKFPDGSGLWIRDSFVLENDLLRADNSLPRGLSIRSSSILNAGQGVWADIQIEKGTVFGPYTGKVLPISNSHAVASEYCWEILDEHFMPIHCIDGKDVAYGNWMRYVNCAIYLEHQNLLAFQHNEQIFYRTIKIIEKGSELLVWYGAVYSKVLGLDKTISVMKANLAIQSMSKIKTVSPLKAAADDVLPFAPPVLNSQSGPDYKNFSCQVKKLETESFKYLVAPPDSTSALASLRGVADPNYEQRPFACRFCSWRSKSNAHLCEHMLTKHDAYEVRRCLECRICFDYPQMLTNHQKERGHTGVEKIFVGPDDDLGRKEEGCDSGLLPKEVRLRPFYCQLCNKRFIFCSRLLLHLARAHTISVVYGCQRCDVEFHEGFLVLNAHQKQAGHRGIKRRLVGANGETVDLSLEPLVRARAPEVPNFNLDMLKNLQETPIPKAIQPSAVQSLPKSTNKATPGKGKETRNASGKPNTHLCEKCLMSFSRANCLTMHLRKHGINTVYRCLECLQDFPKMKPLQTHQVELSHKGIFRQVYADSTNVAAEFSSSVVTEKHIAKINEAPAMQLVNEVPMMPFITRTEVFKERVENILEEQVDSEFLVTGYDPMIVDPVELSVDLNSDGSVRFDIDSEAAMYDLDAAAPKTDSQTSDHDHGGDFKLDLDDHIQLSEEFDIFDNPSDQRASWLKHSFSEM